jgi:hypothetical protein
MAWEELLSIIADARADADHETNTPPTTCPNDGEPLRTGPDGGLYCRFDGWRPNP